MNFVVDAGLVAIIIGLVSVAKMSGLPNRWAPLLSVVLGVVADLAVPHVGISVAVAVLGGIATGLSATGLYSGVKATFAGPTASVPPVS